MITLPWHATEFFRRLATVLLVTLILLLAVETFWEGSVAPYFDINYLVPAAILFGLLALWLHRDEIDRNDLPVVEPSVDEDKKTTSRKYYRLDRIPGVRRLITVDDTTRWGSSVLLVLVLLACFGIRYYFASTGHIYQEEGNSLYDANLILQGEIPFKDFSTRSPGYIYTLALFIKVFGYSIDTARLLCIVAGLVTCLFIFKIGKELYNSNVGLLASVLYSLSPLFAYWGTVAYAVTPSLMFVVVAVYLLIIAIKRTTTRHYFLSGIFIGLSFLFFRGHLTYLALCPLVLLFAYPSDARNLLRSSAVLLLGFSLPVIPALLYFTLQTDLNWMYFHYVPHPSVTTIATTGAEGEPTISYPLAKSRQLYTLFVDASYLAIPGMVFLTLLLKRLLKGKALRVIAIVSVWGLVLSIVVKGKAVEFFHWGLWERMPSEYMPVFVLFLASMTLLSIFLLLDDNVSLKIRPNLKSANTLLLAWAFCASIYFLMAATRSGYSGWSCLAHFLSL